MKKMQISGFIGQDAELRVDNLGKEYVTFSVGIFVGTKDKPKTDWVDVSCNGRNLEQIRYFTKGTKVFIDGFPIVTSYSDKNGNPCASQKLFANTIDILVLKHGAQDVAEDSASSEQFSAGKDGAYLDSVADYEWNI